MRGPTMQERRDFSAAHAEGLHDDLPREFCPDCEQAPSRKRPADEDRAGGRNTMTRFADGDLTSIGTLTEEPCPNCVDEDSWDSGCPVCLGSGAVVIEGWPTEYLAGDEHEHKNGAVIHIA